MSRHLGLSVIQFFDGVNRGTTRPDVINAQFFAAVDQQTRATLILGAEWIGPYLVVPLLYALMYGPLRALGVGHRVAARAAAPTAAAASTVLPLIGTAAGSGEGRSVARHRPAAALASVGFPARRVPGPTCP